MDIGNLRAFVAVSLHRGVGAAANSLGLTPSPVSRSIRDLEAEIGVPLFVRNYHAMDLTDDGRNLLPRAVDVLTRFDAITQSETAPVSAACTPWAPLRYRQRLQTFLEHVDGALVQDDDSALLIHRLMHGDLDLAVVYGPIEEPGISLEIVATVGWVARSAEPLTDDAEELRLSDLKGRSLISSPYKVAPWVKSRLHNTYERAGLEEPTPLSFGDFVSVESRLRRTGEVLMMPTPQDLPFTDIINRGDLYTIPVSREDLSTYLAIAWRTLESDHRALVEQAVTELRGGSKIEEI